MSKLLVIGLDGAAWSMINPNLEGLPHFRRLIKEGESRALFIKEDILLSAALWCTIFSGKPVEEHGHKRFVVDGKLQSREDVDVEFVWDVLDEVCDVRALQVPFIIPPYNFNCCYEPVGYGASSDLDEIKENFDKLASKSLNILRDNPDVFIVIFSALDQVQHFHWGEPLVLDWYKKVDKVLGRLVPFGEKVIVVSDHGFCSKGEARVRTLPDKNDKGEPLKGDHHEEAVLITKNIDYDIKSQKDIYSAILKGVNG